ncbi:MAG: hypothetical protein MK073_02385 [Phycisphaerales bacterium]|nr:hypothetical protein [Phycisphaerales bacterium]
MMKTLLSAFTATLLMTTAIFAEPVTLELSGGKVWRGEIGQTVTVEVDERGKSVFIEGELTRATADYIMVGGELIFVNTIKGMKPDSAGEQEITPENDAEESEQDTSTPKESKSEAKEMKPLGDLPNGVFYLPMHQMVGTYFRPQEIRDLVGHIDENYGPGQIIVLEIDSGGGSVRKWSEIREVIFEARERHRFVAWITHAISGAAATAFLCDEIYYKTTGELGSITMYSGHIDNVSPDWQLLGWISELEGVLAKTSRTPLVAGCMVKNSFALSYDVDEETGEVTYYADLQGEHHLSRYDSNLTLGAEEAIHSGLGDGIADTKEELAAFLDLDEWVEYDTFGEDAAKSWWATLKEFEEVGPELQRQARGDVDGNTPRERINNQIDALQELLKWSKKLGETGEMMGFSDNAIDQIKRGIEDLKHQLRLLDD